MGLILVLILMGTNKERNIGSDKEFKYKTLKKSIFWFVLFLVSLAGGLTLTWWRFKYQPNNIQLWMVPFSLLLLVTPAIVWFSLVFSDICTVKNNDQNVMISRETQSAPSLPEGSNIHADPERWGHKLSLMVFYANMFLVNITESDYVQF